MLLLLIEVHLGAWRAGAEVRQAGTTGTDAKPLRLRLRSHRHECESESWFAFTGCLSLVQASPARVERSRSLVQAHNSTRVY